MSSSAETDFDDTPTNLARPKSSAIITVRIIKSFEFRTTKSMIFHDLDLEETTVGELKQKSLEIVSTQSGWKPYRSARLDTLKIYTKAHGTKTSNLIINLDHDEWILDDDSKKLADLGIENETELSFFNKELYEAFKVHPETRWD